MPKTLLSTFAVRLVALGIAEPSALLAEAIGFIGQAVRAATPQAALPPSMHHPSRPESIRRANRTWPVGWPNVAIDARARRATPLAAGKRSSGHNSRTGIKRVGGYRLPVHGRWRRTTEKGRFDPLAAPSGMTGICAYETAGVDVEGSWRVAAVDVAFGRCAGVAAGLTLRYERGLAYIACNPKLLGGDGSAAIIGAADKLPRG